jgi:hypothetical protein
LAEVFSTLIEDQGLFDLGLKVLGLILLLLFLFLLFLLFCSIDHSLLLSLVLLVDVHELLDVFVIFNLFVAAG